MGGLFFSTASSPMLLASISQAATNVTKIHLHEFIVRSVVGLRSLAYANVKKQQTTALDYSRSLHGPHTLSAHDGGDHP